MSLQHLFPLCPSRMPSQQRFLGTVDLPLSTRITVNLPRRKRSAGLRIEDTRCGQASAPAYPYHPAPAPMDFDPPVYTQAKPQPPHSQNTSEESFCHTPLLLFSDFGGTPETENASLDPLCDCTTSPCPHTYASASQLSNRNYYDYHDFSHFPNAIYSPPMLMQEFSAANAVLAEVAAIQQIGSRSALEKRSRDRVEYQDVSGTSPMKKARKDTNWSATP
ncbi:hypothetical protein AX16_006538 [Volvariella volvacea WC 439]|nr:hypothetical protein AX16_006538 [Volvariella volvacea WC 439]